MVIKGEANIFKLEVAKDLKQLSENAEVVIGKKEEKNITEIKIEDKSNNTTVNFNFVFVGQIPQEQVKEVVERVRV